MRKCSFKKRSFISSTHALRNHTITQCRTRMLLCNHGNCCFILVNALRCRIPGRSLDWCKDWCGVLRNIMKYKHLVLDWCIKLKIEKVFDPIFWYYSFYPTLIRTPKAATFQNLSCIALLVLMLEAKLHFWFAHWTVPNLCRFIVHILVNTLN